jgi:hemoglobin
MKKLLIALLFAGSSLSTTLAQAQGAGVLPGTGNNAVLYVAFGGKEGISRLMNDFVELLVADKRIAVMFKDTKLKNLKEQLTDQICQITGGPCKYEGDNMKAAHADLGITAAHFNALVEDLQIAMDKHGISFDRQSQLLALLAPMHRDIIKPKP